MKRDILRRYSTSSSCLCIYLYRTAHTESSNKIVLKHLDIRSMYSVENSSHAFTHLIISILPVHRPHVGRLTRKNTFSSIKLASIKKTAYINKHAFPTFRSNLNLLSENATYSINSVDSSEIAEYSRPAELIPTQ